MSLRLSTEWLWYVLALYAGFWSPARCGRSPPHNPSTVEAQAKFFQDFFSVQLSPYKIEFGHVCEDPNTWEQRYERNDYKNHRAMGKVRWGDKKGGYGEHYWDLNHAGHSNNHGDDNYDNADDGSYHGNSGSYDEPSDSSPTYGNDEYDPENASYEETNRNKRAYPKVKVERKPIESNEELERYKKRKNREPLDTAVTDKEQHQAAPNHHEKLRRQHEPQHEVKEKQQVVLVVNHKDEKQARENEDNPYQRQPTQYVPYESGAGVRQHQEQTASPSIPRLFLEPSTGHVVDRATGQAYVLQPIQYN